MQVSIIGAGVIGCATALDRGERRYREGDRRGALEIWREVPADDAEHAAVAARRRMAACFSAAFFPIVETKPNSLASTWGRERPRFRSQNSRHKFPGV